MIEALLYASTVKTLYIFLTFPKFFPSAHFTKKEQELKEGKYKWETSVVLLQMII